MSSIQVSLGMAATARQLAPKARIRLGPDGMHYFDRSSGANVLMDEFRFPQQAWAAAPRHVAMALTNACDLDCFFCYAPKTPANLDAGLVRSWMAELDANACLGVGFGGGEPTLYRRLPQLCAFGHQSTNLAITITTHGLRLTPPLIDALAGNVDFVRMSMDGIGPTYERIRGRKFDHFTDALTRVRDVFHVGLNVVINELTVSDLDAVASLADSEGVRELLLLPQAATAKSRGVSRKTISALVAWVAQYEGRVPLAISEPWRDVLNAVSPFTHDTGLRAYVHIDAAGRVKRSSYTTDGVTIDEAGVVAAIGRLSEQETA